METRLVCMDAFRWPRVPGHLAVLTFGGAGILGFIADPIGQAPVLLLTPFSILVATLMAKTGTMAHIRIDHDQQNVSIVDGTGADTFSWRSLGEYELTSFTGVSIKKGWHRVPIHAFSTLARGTWYDNRQLGLPYPLSEYNGPLMTWEPVTFREAARLALCWLTFRDDGLTQRVVSTRLPSD